jgi:hypothetical protein
MSGRFCTELPFWAKVAQNASLFVADRKEREKIKKDAGQNPTFFQCEQVVSVSSTFHLTFSGACSVIHFPAPNSLFTGFS